MTLFIVDFEHVFACRKRVTLFQFETVTLK